ncbi:hypothetical protein D3C79_463900 [compost metagenome]
MGEVETHALRTDQGTLLGHMVPQRLAQGGVQQVSDRVVQGDGLTALAIDHGFHLGALLQGAQFQITFVNDGLASFLGIGHGEDAVIHFQNATVAHLTTGFGVEGGLRQHHHSLFAGDETVHLDAILVDADHSRLFAELLVTGKWGFEIEFQHLVVVHPEAGGFLGTGALLLHLGLEAFLVDTDLALAYHVGGEIRREAIGVIQLEHHLARNDLGIAEVRQHVFQQQQAAVQGADELLLLDAQHALDQRQLGDEFGSHVLHLHRQFGSQLVEEDLGGPQLAAMTHGAADDAAQHIAAAFVGGHDAVSHQEGAGADVVGDDAQGLVAQILGADDLGGLLDQRLEDVDLVVGVHALHDGGDALQAHAGVHGRTGQRLHGAVSLTVELHEDHVPDLDETVAVFFR